MFTHEQTTYYYAQIAYDMPADSSTNSCLMSFKWTKEDYTGATSRLIQLDIRRIMQYTIHSKDKYVNTIQYQYAMSFNLYITSDHSQTVRTQIRRLLT